MPEDRRLSGNYLRIKSRKSLSHPVFLAVLILFFALAGCIFQPANLLVKATGGTDTVQPSQQPSPTAEETGTPAPSATVTPTDVPYTLDPQSLKGTRIRFWHFWTGATGQKIADLTWEFNLENIWGLEIDLRVVGSEDELLQEAVENRSNGSQPPDVITLSGEKAPELAQKQILAPLDAFLANPDWSLTENQISDFYPSLWKQTIVKGKQYAVPLLSSAQVIYYNQTWAQELGFKNSPSTPEDFRKQACAAMTENLKDKKAEVHGTGGWIVNNEKEALINWLNVFQPDLQNPDASLDTLVKNKGLEKTMLYLRGLFDKNCSWISRNQIPYDYFSQRRALFFSGSTQDVIMQARAQERAKSADQWLIIPYPGNNDRTSIIPEGKYLGVLNNSEKSRLGAWLFIRWLSDTSRQVKLVDQGGYLPASKSAMGKMTGKAVFSFGQEEIVKLIAEAQPVYRPQPWGITAPLLEDAFWQLYQQKEGDPSKIIQSLQSLNKDLQNN